MLLHEAYFERLVKQTPVEKRVASRRNQPTLKSHGISTESKLIGKTAQSPTGIVRKLTRLFSYRIPHQDISFANQNLKV